MTIEQFDILEEKVNQLAKQYNQMKVEKDNFSSILQKKDKELSTLQEKVNSLKEERDVIKARLDKIITNLESMAGNF